MRKMTKMPKCEICKENEAEWAMQYIANDDAYDECPECGIQVRVVIEWREAVEA